MSGTADTWVGVPFHEMLTAGLKARGFSQQSVATSLGVSQVQVSKWVRGVNVPDVHQGLSLARLLRVPLEPLVDGTCASFEELDRLSEVNDLVRDLGPDRSRRRLIGLEDRSVPASDEGATTQPVVTHHRVGTSGNPFPDLDPKPEGIVPIAVRDMTESDLKRQGEARRPKPSPKRKPGGSSGS